MPSELARNLPAKIGDVCTAVAVSEFRYLSQVAAGVHADLLQVDGEQTLTPFRCRHTIASQMTKL